MDFLLARLDQLEKDRIQLVQENQKLKFENQELRSELRDEKIKVRLLSAKDEILQMYIGKVAKWMIPDDVIFTDNIPLGATGKILKNKLRDQFGGHKIS